jgi:hypothetical protein
MLRSYYLGKTWMVSRTARRTYLAAAILSLGRFFLALVLRFVGEVPQRFIPLMRPLIFLCVLGAATIMVGMEYFLFGFDKSSPYKKVFWFCVMLLPPLGAPLYYEQAAPLWRL